MSEDDVFDRVREIVAPCPGCGLDRVFNHTIWAHSMKPEWQLKKLKKPQAVADAQCHHCKKRFPIRDWQRSLEQQEFRKSGWVTPRMLVS